MNKKCMGLFGFLFGHNYKPRYTTAALDSNMHHVPPPADEIVALMNEMYDEDNKLEVIDKIERLTRNGNDTQENQYICDVCSRCGDVIRS